jgi:hypothetical protein
VKGIVDPWRIVSPLQKPAEPPRDPKKKIDPSEIDFEADLKIWERCLFKSTHGSIAVVGKDISSADAGLMALAQCLYDLSRSKDHKTLLSNANIGVAFSPTAVPQGSVRLSTKDEPYAALYFMNQSFDEGMLQLIRVLNAVQRRPADSAILRRWGVSTMMR